MSTLGVADAVIPAVIDPTLQQAWKNMRYQRLLVQKMQQKVDKPTTILPCHLSPVLYSNDHKRVRYEIEDLSSPSFYLPTADGQSNKYQTPTQSPTSCNPEITIDKSKSYDEVALTTTRREDNRSLSSPVFSTINSVKTKIEHGSNINSSVEVKRKGSSIASSSNSIDNGDEPDSKRKPSLNESLHRERNKEYSRTWRSKKKLEAELLRNEIDELRSYRRLMEETLDVHVHDANSSGSGFPFRYVSPGLVRSLEINSASLLLGKPFAVLVHPDDWHQVEENFIRVTVVKKPIEVRYRFKLPSSGRYCIAASTLRYHMEEILVLTRML